MQEVSIKITLRMVIHDVQDDKENKTLLYSANALLVIKKKTELYGRRKEKVVDNKKYSSKRETWQFNKRSLQKRGSRNLCGSNNDIGDELDFIYGREIQDNCDNDYVQSHRRYKDRAAAAFAEDLADLRRKRRDMQDRIFDVIDLNAEIEKAKSTLEAADSAFQRYATRGDDTDNCEHVSSKKNAKMQKWIKIPADIEPCALQPSKPRQHRINSSVEAADITDPLYSLSVLPLKKKCLKGKKNVAF